MLVDIQHLSFSLSLAYAFERNKLASVCLFTDFLNRDEPNLNMCTHKHTRSEKRKGVENCAGRSNSSSTTTTTSRTISNRKICYASKACRSWNSLALDKNSLHDVLNLFKKIDFRVSHCIWICSKLLVCRNGTSASVDFSNNNLQYEYVNRQTRLFATNTTPHCMNEKLALFRNFFVDWFLWQLWRSSQLADWLTDWLVSWMVG